MNTLYFRPDGIVRGIYNEDIPLKELGMLRVKRATEMVFDNARQAWRVFDHDGNMVYCSPSRDVCLKWELMHLNWVLENE